jgi:hypothetical protein
MSKYYTPELEEFHVGFEYEALVDYYKQEFEKFTIDDTDSLRSICSTWDRGEVEYWRVKYLDREDIESLGFESSGSEHYFRKRVGTTSEFSIHREGTSLLIEYTEVFRDPEVETIFKGTIKNKSELKKLLKQLGKG